MSHTLFKSVSILSPQSKNHKQTADVFIVDGRILKIGKAIEPDKQTRIVDGKGKFLSPGFFDLNVNIGELGQETKEDLITGCKAAAAGGFTGLAMLPNTQKPIHTQSEVLYIQSKAKNKLVDVYPLGCISHNRAGVELAELFDMHQMGVIAFTDGDRALQDAGLMSRALLYTKGFNGLIFSFPEEAHIAGKGKMNEGAMSTFLGMKGNPALAEELMIARDLYLAAYNETGIHFSTISSQKSVDLIRQAKKKGLSVTCDVAVHHLVFSDDNLSEFDSNYKVKPPLRTQKDREALLEGLNDGTIDAVVSQHTAHEIEFKNVEFEKAAYGCIGLQTAFSVALRAGLSAEQVVEKMAINPRKIVGLKLPIIEVGEAANLVLFDTEEIWTFNAATNQSKSANSPLIGQQIKGSVKWICNNSHCLEF